MDYHFVSIVPTFGNSIVSRGGSIITGADNSNKARLGRKTKFFLASGHFAGNWKTREFFSEIWHNSRILQEKKRSLTFSQECHRWCRRIKFPGELKVTHSVALTAPPPPSPVNIWVRGCSPSNGLYEAILLWCCLLCWDGGWNPNVWSYLLTRCTKCTGDSAFGSARWNDEVWPFEWNVLSSTFPWCYRMTFYTRWF